MSVQLSLGVTQKRGTPQYGSIGASCHLECELPLAAMSGSPERFRRRVQRLYRLCRQAVAAELDRQAPAVPVVAQPADSPPSPAPAARRNGQVAASSARTATTAQLRALQTLAQRQGLDLGTLVHERFAAAPEEILLRDASALIDELKRAVVKN